MHIILYINFFLLCNLWVCVCVCVCKNPTMHLFTLRSFPTEVYTLNIQALVDNPASVPGLIWVQQPTDSNPFMKVHRREGSLHLTAGCPTMALLWWGMLWVFIYSFSDRTIMGSISSGTAVPEHLIELMLFSGIMFINSFLNKWVSM